MHRFFRIVVYIFAAIGFILVVGYVAIRLGWTNTKGVIDTQENFFQEEIASSTQAWVNEEEWQVLKEAILRDKEDIEKAAAVVGISGRLIVTPLVVEQLRLYYSDRELFKKAFAPLKVLGNQSQFSWGVMGIKQETAKEIEDNLKDPASPWYLGKAMENILDFKTDNPDQERFERLTSENSRYYSYLYTALLMRELETQWKKAGFPIGDKPEILATLFNIGFENSKPHADPLSGGALITINDVNYSFGSLAASFYNSEELEKEFPSTH